MKNGLINQEELKVWTGYDRPSDIKRLLDNLNINYTTARNGTIITTEAAINCVFAQQEKTRPKGIAI